MIKLEKLLSAMRDNPRADWSIDDLKSLARRYQVDWPRPGTSHVTFSFDGLEPVTVPAHKPIKGIYVIRFLAMLDTIGTHQNGD